MPESFVSARLSPALRDGRVTAQSELIAGLVKEINDGGYTLVNRFWEATPSEIAEAAVDELGNFMLHPDTYPEVQRNLQGLADKYWSAQ